MNLPSIAPVALLHPSLRGGAWRSIVDRLRRLLAAPLFLVVVAGCGGGAVGDGDATAATLASAASVTRAAALTRTAMASAVDTTSTQWTACATEGQTCAFNGARRVRYGAGTSFVTRTLSGGTTCSNAVFGDPAYGVVKSCAHAAVEAEPAFDASQWRVCVDEGGVCRFDGTRSVRYGTPAQATTRVASGQIDCSNAAFGDPAFGQSKTCWTSIHTVDSGWTACAIEGGHCAFSGTRTVRYGAGESFATGVYTGGVDCSNAVFGDPLFGIVKACSLASTESSAPVIAIPTRSRYVGTNLAPVVYYQRNFPFADLMKSGGGWNSKNDDGSSGAAFPSTAADGTPTALAPGQHAVVALAWDGTHYPAGQYTLLWDGEGTLSFPMSRLKVVSQGPHRIVVEPQDLNAQMWVGIDATKAADPVRNVRFLMPGTESTYATQPFNLVFLQKTAPFSMLRFMDWGATNGSSVREWADRAHVDDVTYGTAKGVPIEIMIDLANALQADPWFCIPHMASDDYVVRFARLLHDRLDPRLHPRIEYSNEVWNTGFSQTQWASAQSDALGLARPWGTPSLFYAKRAVEMFEIVRQVYGSNDAARLVRVIGGQAAWTQFAENALGYGDTAAHADVLAIAPYFSAEDAGDVAKAAATLMLSPGQIVDQMLVSIRGEVKDWMGANAALAARHHLKLEAYESGPGNTTFYFPAAQQAPMTALFAAANASPRMKDVYVEFYAQWKALGGAAMLQYNDIGGWGIYGFWSALEYVYQDPAAAPKYQGLLAVIAADPDAAAPAATTAPRAAAAR